MPERTVLMDKRPLALRIKRARVGRSLIIRAGDFGPKISHRCNLSLDQVISFTQLLSQRHNCVTMKFNRCRSAIEFGRWVFIVQLGRRGWRGSSDRFDGNARRRGRWKCRGPPERSPHRHATCHRLLEQLGRIAGSSMRRNRLRFEVVSSPIG